MPVALQSESEGKLLHIHLSGKLKKEDYLQFVPEVDKAIDNDHTVRMLVDMDEFHGWAPGAAWEDFKFGIRHFSDIERIAIVGDKKWEQWMATLCKPFTRASVRYFQREERAKARDWLSAA